MTTNERPPAPPNVAQTVWDRACAVVEELNQLPGVKARVIITVDTDPQPIADYGDPEAGEEER